MDYYGIASDKAEEYISHLEGKKFFEAGDSKEKQLEQHNDEQLCKISQTAFSAILLQVTVNHKTNTRIERQVRTLSAISIGVQRKICFASFATKYLNA